MEENTHKMLAGQPYDPETTELSQFQHLAHGLCLKYNQIPDTEGTKRQEILDQLFPNHGQSPYIQGPLQVDYGRFTTLGNNFYANFNLTILDTCPVTIGDNVMFGPNVSLITATHPLRWQQRNPHQETDGSFSSLELGKPIQIGNNCWFGSNVTICPGVTIGDGCVIGAGAVVTKDMPADSLVLGVPAKAVRKITEADHLSSYPY
ncbi:sugar O-acetyltransferase [Limosilactobacillus caecicola]|uniref:sugar O-acetyltransferase n=1 Tax=Limosilactobacillus caecicola TaxID=2941332 RepID=UPI0020409578|nr:sugar O-acetyltransferase [Limosilactobacillus caecicola]